MVQVRDQQKTFLYDRKVVNDYKLELPKRKEGIKFSLLSDVMFKAMFYQENRIKYSCKFFSYYLDVSYEELLKHLTLGKNELDKEKEDSKAERSDYVAYIKGTALNIEINCNENRWALDRNMEYAHRLYAKKVKRGSEYQYTQVIQFNLNNFAFEGNEKIVDIYYVQNEEGELLNNKLIFIQIYIPNLRKKWYTSGVDNLKEAERYLLTLIEPEVEISKELGKGDEIMEEYINEAIKVSDDDFLGEAYDKEFALKDQGYTEGKRDGIAEGIEEGKKVGIAEGKRKGIKEGQGEIVKHMCSKYGIDSIVEITGLSIEEVKRYAGKDLREEDFLGEAYDKEFAFKDQGYTEGKRDGIAEGIEEGKKAAQKQIAKQMLKKQLEIDLIAKTTGLSKEEIELL